MGVDGSRRRAGGGCEQPLTTERVAQVVPHLPSFAVDAGFAYRVPPDLVDSIEVGSIVRVPLSGRTVRGYVVAIRDSAIAGLKSTGLKSTGLKDVRSVSGVWSCYSDATLETIRWAATHYVAPLSVVLAKTCPPNLSRRAGIRKLADVSSLAGQPRPTVDADGGGPRQILSGGDWAETIAELVAQPVANGKSVAVILPTVAETRRMAAALGTDFGSRVVEVADQSDATVTTAWSVARQQGGLVVVGTPRISWWPIQALSTMVLVEDGRRGMKERQTPTVAVREIASRRAFTEGFALVHVGRVPTIHTLAEGTAITSRPGRLWPLVEVVDRTEEAPGGGVVTQRARSAVATAVKERQRVLVFTHRHGFSPASRCGSCRLLRTCQSCGSRPDMGPSCARCDAELGPCNACGGRRFEPLGAAVGRVVEELKRVVDSDMVGTAGEGRLVTVATERDLVDIDGVGLAVAVDADGLVRGTNYRAAEDALAILARVTATVIPGRGHRAIIQTADPGHPLFAALRRAEPIQFLRSELEDRRRMSLPPAGEVVVIEVEGLQEPPALEDLEASVFGPAETPTGWRWLIQGDDLSRVRPELAARVARLRERGARVRVDVDPREL